MSRRFFFSWLILKSWEHRIVTTLLEKRLQGGPGPAEVGVFYRLFACYCRSPLPNKVGGTLPERLIWFWRRSCITSSGASYNFYLKHSCFFLEWCPVQTCKLTSLLSVLQIICRWVVVWVVNMTKRDQFPRLPLALGDENDAQRDSMTKKTVLRRGEDWEDATARTWAEHVKIGNNE